MITIEKMTKDRAKALTKIDHEVIDASMEIWGVWDGGTFAAAGGILKDSLLGTGKVWLEVNELGWPVRRAVKSIMMEARKRFGPMIALVAPGRDERFAYFCGFRKVDMQDEMVRVEYGY